jgi:hypothetical protein
VSSNRCECAGAFPALGPLTYLHLDLPAVRAALDGNYERERTWFYATNEAAARSVAVRTAAPVAAAKFIALLVRVLVGAR